MGFRRWYNSQDTGVKAAAVAGIATGALAVVAAIVTGVFAIVNTELNKHGSPSPQPDPGHSSIASPGGHGSIASPSTSPTGPPIAPIRFGKPHPGQREGHLLNVELTGTVPGGEQLWIFVYSTRKYYVQGMPSWQPPVWFLPGVTLGSGAAGDIRAPYTIYAVLASSQADRVIQADYNRTGGNTGTSVIPGGSGAKIVSHITVKRTH